MNKENILREFMREVWNKQGFNKVEKCVHNDYTIYLDTDDPREGKTLSYSEFKKRLKYSLDSFPNMSFEITSAIEEKTM